MGSVVHVRVRWITETRKKTQHALYNELGFGSATPLQLAFLGESDPNLPWEKHCSDIFAGSERAGANPLNYWLPPL